MDNIKGLGSVTSLGYKRKERIFREHPNFVKEWVRNIIIEEWIDNGIICEDLSDFDDDKRERLAAEVELEFILLRQRTLKTFFGY